LRSTGTIQAEVGHDPTIPGHLIRIAWSLGQKFHADAEKVEVRNDPEANALVRCASPPLMMG
jgi:hypothetical protein